MAELTITTDQLRELSYRLRQLYLDQLARLYLKITPVDTSNACGPQITLTTYVKKGFELWIARKTNKRRSTVGELREMLKEGSKCITDLFDAFEASNDEKYRDEDTLTSDLDILDKVSTKFTKSAWEQFRDGYLRIKGCDIEKVLPFINSNVHDSIFEVLRLWVKQNDRKATASNLLQILEEAMKDGYVDQSAIDYLKKLVLKNAVASSYGVEEGKRYGEKYNERYEINSDFPVGKAIIICNHEFVGKDDKKRVPGSKEDVKLIIDLAERMSFSTNKCLDLDEKDLMKELVAASQINYDRMSMLLIVIMSHGSNDGFRTKDWQLVPVSTILNIFNQSNCPGFKDKPKLVINQLCRKERHPPGANVDVTDTRPVAVVKPTELHEQKATPSITGAASATNEKFGMSVDETDARPLALVKRELPEQKTTPTMNESDAGDKLDANPIPMASTSAADDLLHFHVENATVDGFGAYRGTKGSRFIRLVVNEINNAKGEQHVLDIFTKVRAKMDHININSAENKYKVQLSSSGPSNLKKLLYLPKPKPQ